MDRLNESEVGKTAVTEKLRSRGYRTNLGGHRIMIWEPRATYLELDKSHTIEIYSLAVCSEHIYECFIDTISLTSVGFLVRNLHTVAGLINSILSLRSANVFERVEHHQKQTDDDHG